MDGSTAPYPTVPLSQVINSEPFHDAGHVLETLYSSHTRDCIKQMKGDLQSLNKDSFYYDGFQFYLIIVDEYSQYIWHFLMAHKSNVAMIVSTFLKQMENQFITRVKIIQSDGSGEFISIALQTYVLANGIIHRLSCPGTPGQNGLAKRWHRHIVETGLTLLAHASVPTKFWTAAFNTAMLLINPLPTPILGQSHLMRSFLDLLLLMILYVFLGVNVIHCLHLWNVQNWSISPYVMFFLYTQQTTKATGVLNHTQAASIFLGM